MTPKPDTDTKPAGEAGSAESKREGDVIEHPPGSGKMYRIGGHPEVGTPVKGLHFANGHVIEERGNYRWERGTAYCRVLIPLPSPEPAPETPQVDAPSGSGNPRDWPEDFMGENGNYSQICCECKKHFTGHKRRVACKLCVLAKEARTTADGSFAYQLTPRNWSPVELRALIDERIAAKLAEFIAGRDLNMFIRKIAKDETEAVMREADDDSGPDRAGKLKIVATGKVAWDKPAEPSDAKALEAARQAYGHSIWDDSVSPEDWSKEKLGEAETAACRAYGLAQNVRIAELERGLEMANTEAHKYWVQICDTMEALGLLVPETAPYSVGHAKKKRLTIDALRDQVADLKRQLAAANDTIEVNGKTIDELLAKLLNYAKSAPGTLSAGEWAALEDDLAWCDGKFSGGHPVVRVCAALRARSTVQPALPTKATEGMAKAASNFISDWIARNNRPGIIKSHFAWASEIDGKPCIQFGLIKPMLDAALAATKGE